MAFHWDAFAFPSSLCKPEKPSNKKPSPLGEGLKRDLLTISVIQYGFGTLLFGNRCEFRYKVPEFITIHGLDFDQSFH